MNLTLHSRRFTKTLPKNTFDYGEALREELITDNNLHEEFIQACEGALELVELIDQPDFWDNSPLKPQIIISIDPGSV